MPTSHQPRKFLDEVRMSQSKQECAVDGVHCLLLHGNSLSAIEITLLGFQSSQHIK